LDFRGVQGIDANTAIIMSTGKADLSRIYKTVDGCLTWKLVFTNPDSEGSFQAIRMGSGHRLGMALGVPVLGRFRIFSTYDFGESWSLDSEAPKAKDCEKVFAASNSSFAFVNSNHLFITGGCTSRLFFFEGPGVNWRQKVTFRELKSKIPMLNLETAGAVSIAYGGDFRYKNGKASFSPVAVVVGGDSKKPDHDVGNAAYSFNGGRTWNPSVTSPGGYRSAVAFDPNRKLWIAVGPNGTDISIDDGNNWSSLKSSSINELDQNWNAISLPFVVGTNGLIGKLTSNAFGALTKSPVGR